MHVDLVLLLCAVASVSWIYFLYAKDLGHDSLTPSMGKTIYLTSQKGEEIAAAVPITEDLLVTTHRIAWHCDVTNIDEGCILRAMDRSRKRTWTAYVIATDEVANVALVSLALDGDEPLDPVPITHTTPTDGSELHQLNVEVDFEDGERFPGNVGIVHGNAVTVDPERSADAAWNHRFVSDWEGVSIEGSPVFDRGDALVGLRTNMATAALLSQPIRLVEPHANLVSAQSMRKLVARINEGEQEN